MEALTPSSPTLQWRRLMLSLVSIIMLAALALTPAQPGAPLRANQGLLTLATDQPAAIVSVVVQKRTNDARVEQLTLQIGGTITRSLPVINAFAATIRAGAIPTLARSEAVRWISFDAPVVKQSCAGTGCIDPARIANAYVSAVNAPAVWNRTTPLRGKGIGVAVVDSGVNPHQELYTPEGRNRLIASVALNNGYNSSIYDAYGHGNHVAGVIGSNGSRSGGTYLGVAPEINIINVKVSDDVGEGVATTSTLVAGLEWVYNNRKTYNIRVVNISLTDSVIESYHVSPVAAAVELLWFNGVVVVAAAGNNSDGGLAAPANDPFVITVGATDDRGTADIRDDTMASWSAWGRTVDGFAKPDLVAPGTSIIAPLPMPNSTLASRYPANVVQGPSGSLYFRMSGTSVSAPIVAAAAALLLQDEPNLTPDQVKYRLMTTARPFSTRQIAGAGHVDVLRAVDGTTTQSANTGIQISAMLQDGQNAAIWSSTSWSTAKWSTAKWSTAKWSTAKWSTSR